MEGEGNLEFSIEQEIYCEVYLLIVILNPVNKLGKEREPGISIMLYAMPRNLFSLCLKSIVRSLFLE